MVCASVCVCACVLVSVCVCGRGGAAERESRLEKKPQIVERYMLTGVFGSLFFNTKAVPENIKFVVVDVGVSHLVLKSINLAWWHHALNPTGVDTCLDVCTHGFLQQHCRAQNLVRATYAIYSVKEVHAHLFVRCQDSSARVCTRLRFAFPVATDLENSSCSCTSLALRLLLAV